MATDKNTALPSINDDIAAAKQLLADARQIFAELPREPHGVRQEQFTPITPKQATGMIVGVFGSLVAIGLAASFFGPALRTAGRRAGLVGVSDPNERQTLLLADKTTLDMRGSTVVAE